LAQEILDENLKSLSLIDAALALPQFQIPEILTLGENFEYLSGWKDISRLMLLRALVEFRTGKENEAVNSTLRVVRLGHQIEDCGGGQIHYLVGAAIKQMALGALGEMIARATLSCDVLKVYAHKLEQLGANQMGLTNVTKLNYQLLRANISDLASGKNMGISNATMRSAAELLNKPFFNPGKTHKIYADHARARLECIPQMYREILTHQIAVSTNDSVFQLLISGNFIGESLARISKTPSEKVLSQKCRENVAVSATQILLALKCYTLKFQMLPESLNDLVPEFLPVVPVDDFDGKPLRYSPEKKIIYSVGADLMDSGGQKTNAARESLDIPFKINF